MNDSGQAQEDNNAFYKTKIAILERELAEKTRILQTTSQILCDSQKQYQQLLSEYKKITAHKIEPSTIECDFFNNVINSRQNRDCFNQPLVQLQDFEETINKLSIQMNRLRRQKENTDIRNRKWKNVAYSIFNEVKDLVAYDQPFPCHNIEAQQTVILDLIKRFSHQIMKKNERESLIQTKYQKAKEKLTEVQRKCDKMLLLLETNGINFTSNQYFSS